MSSAAGGSKLGLIAAAEAANAAIRQPARIAERAKTTAKLRGLKSFLLPAVSSGPNSAERYSSSLRQARNALSSSSCRRRRHALGLDAAAERDRLLELRDVVAAGVALGQVRLEAHAVVAGESVLEVVGDDLDELAAGHLG